MNTVEIETTPADLTALILAVFNCNTIDRAEKIRLTSLVARDLARMRASR